MFHLAKTPRITSDLHDRPQMGRCYHSGACPDLPGPARAYPLEIFITEADSVEFVVDNEDENVKPEVEPIKIEPDPRQFLARVAAISVRQPASTASTSSEEAQRPSTSSYRTQLLCCVPSNQLGPADPPRRPGRPKGSKSRPRIAAIQGLPVPPIRAAAARANAGMTSKPNRS